MAKIDFSTMTKIKDIIKTRISTLDGKRETLIYGSIENIGYNSDCEFSLTKMTEVITTDTKDSKNNHNIIWVKYKSNHIHPDILRSLQLTIEAIGLVLVNIATSIDEINVINLVFTIKD